MKKILVFDLETTGLPKRFDSPASDLDNWPRVVELAWVMFIHNGRMICRERYIIRPEGFRIPIAAMRIHGINNTTANKIGVPLWDALQRFARAIEDCDMIVAHNMAYDGPVIEAEFLRTGIRSSFSHRRKICTMLASTKFCAIKRRGGSEGTYKWPKLEELYLKLFNRRCWKKHSALLDASRTRACFNELVKRGVIEVRFSWEGR